MIFSSAVHFGLHLLTVPIFYILSATSTPPRDIQTLKCELYSKYELPKLSLQVNEKDSFEFSLAENHFKSESFKSESMLSITLCLRSLPWISYDASTRTLTGSPPSHSSIVHKVHLCNYSLHEKPILELQIFVTKQAAPSIDDIHFQGKRLSRRTLDESPKSIPIVNSTDESPLRRGVASDVVVWEGQENPLRIQLDPDMLYVPPSLTGSIIASEGPASYYAMLDNSGPLPSWIKFDTSLLEFSGVPPHGTYRQTTILTIVVQASTVPGFIQATVRFNIKILVHSLALSTLTSRTCSSSILYTNQEQDNLWQYYLPDLNLEAGNRNVNFEFSMELFRIDGCIQPVRAIPGVNNLNDTAQSLNAMSTYVRRHGLSQTPGLTQIVTHLSAQSAQELFRSNNTLPDWLVFDSGRWTLTGTIPQSIVNRILLDVFVTDSFNTTSNFKLQIYAQPVAQFTFKQSVPDVWVMSGKSFEIDLPLSDYLTNIDDTKLQPVESKFTYEVIDPAESNPNIQYDSEPSTFRLTSHNNSITTRSAVGVASCTVDDLWRQENLGNGERVMTAIFPSWFTQNSATTLKTVLSGTIPCETTIRVRWIAKNGQNHLTAMEFLVHATLSGLTVEPNKPSDPTPELQHHGVNPVAFKIAVAFAIALPAVLAIWFFIKRFCLPPKDQPEQSAQTKGRRNDLESGWPVHRNGRGPDFVGADISAPIRGQMASEIVTSSQPDYRSSYEDDPSVGHRDSYSEKYVAEHHAWACSSENEVEGSGSERTLTFGWFLGGKSPVSSPIVEGSSLNSGDLTLRRLNSDASKYSLKRVSVGYPFECSRFGFVNGNRISHYDCSPKVESQNTEADTNTSLQEEAIKIEGATTPIANDTPQRSSTALTVPSRSGSKRSKSTFKRKSKLFRRSNESDSKRRNRSTSNVKSSSVKGDNSSQSKSMKEVEPRVCYSSISTGTGYMASMSECNTSIDERQNSTVESGDDIEIDNVPIRMNALEMEEYEKDRRRLSRTKLKSDIKDIGHDERISWTPILDLDAGTGLHDAEYSGGLKSDRFNDQIIRSDSGALMYDSIGVSHSNLQVLTAINTVVDKAFISKEPQFKVTGSISPTHLGGNMSDKSESARSDDKDLLSSMHASYPCSRSKVSERYDQSRFSGSDNSVFYSGSDEGDEELYFSIQSESDIKEQSVDESHHSSEEDRPSQICAEFKDVDQDLELYNHERLLSYSSALIATSLNIGVQPKYVKATIGTAFHYISPLSGSSSSSPLISGNSQTPFSQPVSSSNLVLTQGSLGPTSIQGEPTTGDYKAYIVSDPQGQSKQLPDWIQFNSRLCSIWGRPTPETVGEWKICFVLSNLPMQPERVVEMIILNVREPIEVPPSPALSNNHIWTSNSSQEPYASPSSASQVHLTTSVDQNVEYD